MKKPLRTLALTFQPALDDARGEKDLRDGLSTILQVGHTLWLADDESASIERLTLRDGAAGEHRQFKLGDFVELPDGPDGEVDVEGMDMAGGYLWVVGSHSFKRCPPDGDGVKPRRRLKELADIDPQPNRFLLARIPLAIEDGLPALARNAQDDGGKRRAQWLPIRGKQNRLTRLLGKDPHIAPFIGLPGKENGFDIEGLAVNGERLFLGLRGPVLRGWGTVLELRPEGDGDALKLARFHGRQGRKRVRKHFLDLDGLGIRDLHFHGQDLLLLAGPTMALDGPVRVLRWRGAAECEDSCIVEREALEHVLELPYGKGCDHAEGMTLLREHGDDAPALLVVHDQPAPGRQPGQSTLLADVYPLQ